MTRVFKELFENEDGATAVEYGLIAGAMAIALIPVLKVLSSDVDGLFGVVLELFDHPSLSI